jgi:4a-hydroxytetrahydrobiopterin dehydratase
MQAVNLSPEEIERTLHKLDGWSVRDGKLHREFEFPDFLHAFGFMTSAAIAIEKMNHHPEWFNVYGRVVVDLVTHESGGITQRDVKLAQLLNQFASKLL